MTNLLLFGPPGIGKSTQIEGFRKYFPDRGIYYDLEQVWNDRPMKGRILQAVTNMALVQKELSLKPMIIGAAGLDAQRTYPGFRKVLLITKTQEEYIQRRDERNKFQPNYAKQGEHLISDWINLTKWDNIQLAGDIAETLGALSKLAKV